MGQECALKAQKSLRSNRACALLTPSYAGLNFFGHTSKLTAT